MALEQTDSGLNSQHYTTPISFSATPFRAILIKQYHYNYLAIIAVLL
jgi:hypothetical protein